jgi:NADPH2:quinone reductase
VVLNNADLVANVRAVEPNGPDHIVEVAFAANVERDIDLLKMGGSLATYATNDPKPAIPFWPMVFNNIQVNFLGSDDFPISAKLAAANDLNAALEAGWSGFEIAERIPLAEIAHGHELVDHPARPGRIVLTVP